MITTRRRFLSTSAGAFAGFQILPSSAVGANERVNVAFIGAGGKGMHAIRSLAENKMVNFTAFADVDDRRAVEARKVFKENGALYLFVNIGPRLKNTIALAVAKP